MPDSGKVERDRRARWQMGRDVSPKRPKHRADVIYQLLAQATCCLLAPRWIGWSRSRCQGLWQPAGAGCKCFRQHARSRSTCRRARRSARSSSHVPERLSPPDLRERCLFGRDLSSKRPKHRGNNSPPMRQADMPCSTPRETPSRSTCPRLRLATMFNPHVRRS